MSPNKVKLSKFSTVLSQLRKERGISQKKAASELGISQALLSHYEKGIRECGLDFVIKCSEYYGVTTDYLLGVSENRNGFRAGALAFEETDGHSFANLAAATSLLLDSVSAGLKDKKEKSLIYDYYLLSVYRGALTLAKTGILPKENFKFDLTAGKELANAAIAVQEAKIALREDKSRTGTDAVAGSAVQSLINEAEKHIENTIISE